MPLRGAGDTGKAVDAILCERKMAKRFEPTITDNSFDPDLQHRLPRRTENAERAGNRDTGAASGAQSAESRGSVDSAPRRDVLKSMAWRGRTVKFGLTVEPRNRAG
jgi:hypothetical protein